MDKEKLWQDALNQLQLNLSKSNFSLWFGKTFIKSLKREKEKQFVEIACQNFFVRDQLKTNYATRVKAVLEQLTGLKNEVFFVVGTANKPSAPQQNGPLFNFDPQKEKARLVAKAIAQARLNPEYTFENFAVASTNEMAYAAATAVAKTPGSLYNPFFIYGGVGVGKTHLMQAMGIRVLEKNPETSFIYCSGEEFTNEIIEAIRNKTTSIFKKKFRNAKMLLIDDIQFIAGRDAVQEEFFHTFNAVKQLGGQIVMTSDRLPEQIEGLEDRLRSRFEGGLMIDIQQPNFELRTAILLIKAKQRGETLPIEVAKLIAQQIQSTRKLEGVLVRLFSEKNLTQKPLDLVLAQKVLAEVNATPFSFKGFLKPEKIIKTVADFYHLNLNEIKGQRRLKEYVFPRQIAIYLLRKELNLTYQEIGRLFGGKDHSTVIHSERKITELLASQPQLQETLTQLKKIFEA